jgi:hypothetical protein
MTFTPGCSATSTTDVASDEAVVDWLLAGDPAIRWQVMRDLLDKPPGTWERERARVVQEGG